MPSGLDESLSLSLSLLYLLSVCEATIIVCLAAASAAPGAEVGLTSLVRNTSCGNITHNELYLCRRQRASESGERRRVSAIRSGSCPVRRRTHATSCRCRVETQRPGGAASACVVELKEILSLDGLEWPGGSLYNCPVRESERGERRRRRSKTISKEEKI